MEVHPDLTPSVIFGLGWYYMLMFVLNFGWAIRSYKRHEHIGWLDRAFGQEIPSAAIWAAYSSLLLMVSLAHLTGYHQPGEFLIRMPDAVKTFVNSFADPVSYFTLSIVLFVLMIWLRRWWIQPTVIWLMLNLSLLFMGLSMTDFDFRQIVGKPDNVPIVAMLYIVAYFTWIYFKRSVENDDLRAAGKPVREEVNNEKVLVWPDLVYSELICMVVVTVVLVMWGIVLQAPLEEPGSSVKTPNPSKAPWYFLGLQEMLVYYDPWLAGVVFPSLVVVGLMAIPYIDFNKLGNGYYTYSERKFAVITFLFGFLPLWVAMIVLGTFLRGPNWNFFGIYEYWDVHKLEALNNVNLSEYFWLEWLGVAMPMPDPNASFGTQLGVIVWREAIGFLVIFLYFAILPPLMAVTAFRSFFIKMGFIRFSVLVFLLLSMAALPIKMVLRWAFNLKYIVAIPELFFNI